MKSTFCGRRQTIEHGRHGNAGRKGLDDKGFGNRLLDRQGYSGTRPAIMPFEARDTLCLQLEGKIDQWFAKTDGSGAVFLMNVTDTAEAHKLLEALPLGQAEMMTFELIPIGPLWPLGLMLAEPTK
jgi:hypothetical protein